MLGKCSIMLFMSYIDSKSFSFVLISFEAKALKKIKKKKTNLLVHAQRLVLSLKRLLLFGMNNFAVQKYPYILLG